jgi:hypothetical protein
VSLPDSERGRYIKSECYYISFPTHGGFRIAILEMSSKTKESLREIDYTRYDVPAEVLETKTEKLNSVACSPQVNYTDRAAAAC